MTVEQAGGERVWALGAAVTVTAISATLYPAIWIYTAVAVAAGLVVAGLPQSVLSAVRGSGSKASKATTKQVLDLIRSRRSVQPKDFTGSNTGITQQKLETMLDAARWAPTHKQTEPWHFVVLSGSGKAEFEALTIKCCQELLPPEKSQQVVAQLQGKQRKEWSKVGWCFGSNSPAWHWVCHRSCGMHSAWCCMGCCCSRKACVSMA
eukprot:GHUV01003060.1.p1 GENE.GHUV01003060.1~~GHUV01003060.1.p1  ORF type:complete len:207 (+),score=54.02 GHUV01003060.1:252-872(+)